MELEEFNQPSFEKRLLNLKDTQESIAALSAWCLQKRANHKKIVSSWLNVLKQVKIEHRLTLFYLANDVIQYSKRKNYEFVDSWGTTLQKATTLVREEKVKNKILRIFKIWEQREVYTEEFLADLYGLLNITTIKKNLPPLMPKEKSASSLNETGDEYQSSTLAKSIRECVNLEKSTDKNLKVVVKLAIPDLEKIKISIKDRSQVEDVEREIEENTKKNDKYVHSLKSEIKARKILLTALDQAEEFYNNQRGDVKVVVNAYRNFGNRIKSMKKKLDELSSSLPSPIPSPDINAPSPEPDNDFDLPGEQNFYNSMNGFTSYMNSSLPFDISDFRKASSKPDGHPIQSIQVIQSRAEEGAAPINDFYKSLIPSQSDPFPPNSNAPTFGYGSKNFSGPPPPPMPVGYGKALQNMQQNNFAPPPPPPPNMGYTPAEMHSYGNLPMMAPPMPPALDRSTEEYDPWNELPWNASQNADAFDQSIMETPVSPPSYERKGHDNDMIEYDENLGDILIGSGDIDHRQMLDQSLEAATKDLLNSTDIDHRNLISLTGSPGQKPNSDNDYRQLRPGQTSTTSDSESFSQAPSRNTNTNVHPPKLLPDMITEMDQFLSFADNEMAGILDDSLDMPNTSFPPPNQFSRQMSAPPPRSRNGNPDMPRPNGRDNVESIDMELSDDDANGEDRDRDFFNSSGMFPGNMSHPPPLLPSEELENLQQQNHHRKSNNWNNNATSSNDMEEIEDGPRNDQWNGPNLLGPPGIGSFMGTRPPFNSNFRGRGNRGGNSPYMPRGGRGVRGAPRGNGPPRGFRGGNGNFRGRGGSW